MTDRLDVASRVADALHHVAAPDDLASRIVERAHRRRARHRALRTGVALAAAVVVAAGALTLVGSRERSDDSVVADDSSAVFRWEVLPEAPIPPRARSAAVWTGTEVIVWGGGNGTGSSRDGLRADGAAYDPTTGGWRVLPQAPIGPRAETIDVWTGTEVLVWGGVRPEDPVEEAAAWADGAAYDPASDTWRRIPDAPINPRVGAGYAWTGEELVVVGGASAGGPGARTIGAAYDPDRNSWRLLPDLAFRDTTGGWAAWTGREVLYWRPYGEDVVNGQPPNPRLFAYDPESDTWRKATDRPEAFALVSSDSARVWSGTRVIFVSQRTSGDKTWADLEAVAYDPEADSWQRVATAENKENMFLPPSAALWTGHEVVTLNWSAHAVSTLHPPTGTWRKVPEGPAGLFGWSAAVVDDDIYVFGDETNARLVRERS